MSRIIIAALSVLALACADEPADSGSGGASSTAAGGTSAGGMTSASGAAGGTGGSGGFPMPGASCDALPAPMGNVIMVGPGDNIVDAVAGAASGDTVMLAAGSYDMDGRSLWVGADNVSIRGATGDPADVVLDGNYNTNGGGLINLPSVSNVTIADVTLQRPRFHAIHVTGGDAPANDNRIYNVRLFDPGEQAIKVNTAGNGNFADDGEIACSHIELTAAGQQQVMSYTSSGSNCYTGGVDAHDARGWTVRHNTIVGFWCSNSDLAEHGIHFWTGSRDTHVDGNVLIDNARGIGFGLVGGGRSYNDSPCGNTMGAGHYGGTIVNNFVVATDGGLFSSPNGVDTGISLWYACNATVAHNTIAFTTAPFSGIEWRFGITSVDLVNNFVSHSMQERGNASGTLDGNIEDAPLSDLSDVDAYDLHLVEGATAIGTGSAAGLTIAASDIDGDARTSPPDVGADQR